MTDTLTGYDALSDDEMAELVADPETLHLYDPHRIIALLRPADIDAGLPGEWRLETLRRSNYDDGWSAWAELPDPDFRLPWHQRSCGGFGPTPDSALDALRAALIPLNATREETP